MKTIYLSLLCAVIISVFNIHVHAQQKTPPKIQWQRSLGGNSDERAQSVQQTTDGGYIVGGCTTSIDGDVSGYHGYHDCWVVKLRGSGMIEWQRTLGGSDLDHILEIRQTNDGGYIVAGVSSSVDGDVSGNHGSYDYWIVKLTSSGTIDWERSIGGSDEDGATSICQTADGGFIVSGYTRSADSIVSSNHGGRDYWVVKLGYTGIIEWERSYGGSRDDMACSIIQTDDGGYIVVGDSRSDDGDLGTHYGSIYETDYWVVKLTSEGNIEWDKILGGTDYDDPTAIRQTSDGGFIVVGQSRSNSDNVTGNHGITDFWVVKLSRVGGLEWEKSLGGSKWDGATSVEQTSDGGYIVAGHTISIDGDVIGLHGNGEWADFWIVKLTSAGEMQWQKTLGGSSEDAAYSIKQTTDGGYIVAGSSKSNDGDASSNGDGMGHHGATNAEDYWVVKLSPEGTSSVESESVTTQNISIVPNPASTSATLTLDSDEAGACEVQIISVTGATLKEYSTRLTTGKQEIALTDLESLPSGMYEVIVKRSCCQTLRTKLIVQ